MALSYKPGDIDLKELTLINYRGVPTDLKVAMEEFTVFHDLYANGMQCEVLIVDSLGLVEFLPIVGDETLIINFRTPTFDDFRSYIFRVFKIDHKTKSNDRTDNYVIKGISQEVINDRKISVDKSYTDTTGSDIVRSVYNNYLKANEQDYGIVKKKNLYVQDTSINHHLVNAGVGPFEVINHMCSESRVKEKGKLTEYNFRGKKVKEEELVDESKASNFVFYESYNGWYFRTLDSLLVQEPSEDFYFTNAKVEPENKEDLIGKHQIINSLTYDKQFDTLESMEEGLYFNIVEAIDPILKRFEVFDFTYTKNKGDIAHLEKLEKKKVKDQGLFNKDSLFAKGGQYAHRHYFQSNIGNYKSESSLIGAEKKDPQIRNPRQLQTWLNAEVASRTQLNQMVFSVGIPGNTEIEIGQVVNLFIPQNSELEDYKKKHNLLYGNRFLVTTVRHTFNKEDNSFFTVFEAVKDIYAKKVIEEADSPIVDDFDL